MTTVWTRIKKDTPQTHALIIGVGAYRHLPGGKNFKPIKLNIHLNQLTSPPISARLFADWLLRQFNNPEAPLGSVEILLSEHSPQPYTLPNGQSRPVYQATIEAIYQAYKRWRQRCNTNPENIAIFYFCGHGIMIQGDHFLLADDYGADDLQALYSSIHFERLYQVMASCQAQYQWYFIDACSDIPFEGLKIMETGARSFGDTSPLRPMPSALVLHATSPGQEASSKSGKASLFTEALLLCLGGLASEYDQGAWVVTNTLLSDRIIRVVERLCQLTEHEIQLPSYRNTMRRKYLHILQQPPRLPLTIRFDPHQAINEAKLTLTSLTNPVWQAEREPSLSLTWEFEQVEAGHYALNAFFQPGRYQAINREILWVMPPGPWPIPDPIRCK